MCFLSPALRRIVTALSAGSALIAAAGEPVILRDFSDSARYTVRKPFAVPSPDGATLRIDTTASGDEWTPVFLTGARHAEAVHHLRRDVPLPGRRP